MRLDDEGNLYILEINSLPSLGEHGSYCVGAAHVGLDFAKLINRLVEVASARYFGLPEPPQLDGAGGDPSKRVFSFITQRRDALERRLREWTAQSSHTMDLVGLQEMARRVDGALRELGLRPVQAYTDARVAWTWETTKGFEGGTLFVGHLDVPTQAGIPAQMFRREREWLYGEGIGSSRAPLVMLEFVLRALRSARQLRRLPIGVLYYGDEGRDARHSAEIIRSAAAKAKRVFVLRPGNVGDHVITQRRGQRRYQFRVEGESLRPGKKTKKPETLRWTMGKLEEFSGLTAAKKRVSVSAIDVQTERLPMLLPHRVTATVVVTYPEQRIADEIEEEMRGLIGKSGPRWELKQLSDRPPMRERRANLQLAKSLGELAEQREIPLKRESSVWPSVAGLVPAKTACVCGIGPVARDLGMPNEAVQRISLVQRTLLLAEFLAIGGDK
jgi:D-alanine-D-alanine ligase